MVEPAKSLPPLPDDGPLPGESPRPGERPLPEDGPLPGEEVPAAVERPFGDPTDSERIRAADEFIFKLPELPRDLTWAKVREALVGRDRETRYQRGAIAAVAFVLLCVWGWRERYVRWPLETLSGHTKSVFALATTPRRSLLATGGDDHAIRLWTLDTGELVRTIETDKRESGDGVIGLAFSPKGDLLVAATGGGAQLWAVESGQLVRTLDPWERGSLAVAYSPRGDSVAVSRRGDDTIRVFATVDGALVHTLRGHVSDVFGLAYAPSGDQLASVSGDGTLRIWSLATFREVRVLSHPGNALAVAYSPAGDLLASTGDDHVLRVWNAFDGTVAAPELRTSGSVRSLAFSITGDRLFFGGDDQVVRGVSPRSGTLVFSRVQTDKPLAVALSSDGENLAVGLSTGAVPVWWVSRGK